MALLVLDLVLLDDGRPRALPRSELAPTLRFDPPCATVSAPRSQVLPCDLYGH